jgi:hypothetical protein
MNFNVLVMRREIGLPITLFAPPSVSGGGGHT